MLRTRMSSRSGKNNNLHRSLIASGGKKKGRPTISSYAINMNESKEEYVIYVAVPGMQRKDFAISIDKKELIVSASKNEAIPCYCQTEEQTHHPHWVETFTLPDDADTVMTAAVYRNGELEIHIPKGKKDLVNSPVDIFIY